MRVKVLSTISICSQNKRSLLRDILLTQHLLGGLAILTLSYVNCVKNILRLAGQGNCQCFLLTSHVETCTELYCKLQQSENLNNSTASASVQPFIQLMVIGSNNSQIFCV